MDNITHTLIGLAEGQAVALIRSRRSPELRPVFWFMGALANNLPDLDFVYAPITRGKLGYLLHHRGHTHTISAVFGETLLLLFVFWLWKKRRRSGEAARLRHGDWAWLALLAWLGLLSHLAMDYTNVYGVHPFWPFDSHWHFGDTLFIVEPLIWVALAPALALSARSAGAKATLTFLAALGPALCLFSGYVPWQLALGATAAALWMTAVSIKLKAGPRLVAAATAFALVLGTFGFAQRVARAELLQLLAHRFPKTKVHDLALSPMPANPLCWSMTTVETEDDRYVSRRAIFALAPKWLGAAQCPELVPVLVSAPLREVAAPPRPEILWKGQFEARLSELAELRRKYCDAAALLRFLRVPFWNRQENSTLLGDLRFDRSPTLEFSELALRQDSAGSDCPAHVPPWIAPRAELF